MLLPSRIVGWFGIRTVEEKMGVIDVLGWLATGAILVGLLWAANYRGRIHSALRQRTPDLVVDAARQLWRARMALVVALEA
jgi:hypothetical protein